MAVTILALYLCPVLLINVVLPTGRIATFKDELLVKDVKSSIIKQNHDFLQLTLKSSYDGRMARSSSWMSRKQLNKQQHTINGNISGGNLKVAHWNLGSKLWSNKRQEIELLLEQYKPDLCFITEANLWKDTEPHETEILEHKLVYPNTMDTMAHARIILIVKQEIEVTILHQYMDGKTVSIWVRVGSSRKKSLVIGGLYREHNQLGTGDRAASSLVQQREQEIRWDNMTRHWRRAGTGNKCFVFGDLNLDHGKWLNPDQHQEVMVRTVQDNLETTGFIQLVQGITRTWRNQADSTLDHIWTNSPNRVVSVFNDERPPSDHNVTGATLSIRDITMGGQNSVRRQWSKFSEVSYLNKCKNMDWSPVLAQTCPDLANSLLEEKLLGILDSEAPMAVFQTRTHYSRWLTDSTKDQMVARDVARTVARISNEEADWTNYRRLRNLCTSQQRKDRSDYLSATYARFETENDSRKLYSLTKQLLGWNGGGSPTTFCIEGRMITRQQELANTMVNFYWNKVNNIKHKLPRVRQDPLWYLRKAFSRWQPPGRIPEFSIQPVTLREVVAMINNLKQSHAYGIDKLDAASVKLAVKYLAGPITHIVNLSLSQNNFLQKWKLARILPVLKSKGLDKSNPGSFRPISQLPIIGKLTERSVQLQLLKHLEQWGLLGPNHHAYRHKTSTTTALLELCDRISTGADENSIIGSMSVDQTSAFDCVEHDVLIRKLDFYHLSPDTIAWISSYLKNRSGYVVVGSADSNIRSNPHGVPQGSVLGPLLYLIYINEFPMVTKDDFCLNRLHSDTTMLWDTDCMDCGALTAFADDAQYLSKSRSRMRNQIRIEEVYVRMVDFLNSNGLEVNAGKTTLTEYMSHQKRSKLRGIPPELSVTELVRDKLEDSHITDSTYSRFLGLNLKNNLGWEAHLSTGKRAILPTIRKHLGAIHSLRGFLTKRAKLQLANSFIISRLLYGMSLWGNTNRTQLARVQVCLNATARFVLNAPRYMRQSELMSGCGWLTVSEMVDYVSLVSLWKVVRWQTPHYMVDKILVCDDDKLWTKYPRLILTAEAWRCRTTSTWNTLPDFIRAELSIRAFKLNLRRWLVERRTTESIDADGEPD